MPNEKNNIFFILALVFAIWFALTSWAWTYLVNLFLSLPSGILSFLFYRAGVKSGASPRLQTAIKITWGVGVVSAVAALIFFR